MPEWVIAILSALVALILREMYEWLRRPRLVIDFEKWIGIKPRIVDFSLGERVMDIESKARYLRLKVYNIGRKPALACEAKVAVFSEECEELAVQPLHWARRDPKLYKTLEQIYASIHLNPRDNELLDVLELNYDVDINTKKPGDLSPGCCLETLSPYSIMLERDTTYQLEITVYASNAISKPFAFTVCWDGTLDGIESAFKKLKRIKKRDKIDLETT